MAFVPVPNTAQLNLGYTTDTGDTWSNSLYLLRATGWTTTTLEQLCNEAADAWAELMPGIFAANCNLTQISAIDLTTASGAYAAATTGLPVAGTRSGAAIMLNVAMSVTLRTELRGRSYRGRIFHYGLANEDKQTEKLWQSDDAVTVGNAYDALFDVLSLALSCTPVVVSRYSGGASRITGVATPITVVEGRLPVATQRRRVKPS